MAEPASGRAPIAGRIRPADADQVLIAAAIQIASSAHEDADRETALWLLARALPMAGSSARVRALVPVAERVLAAAPGRRSAAGAAAWARVCLELGRVVARDALSRVMALVGA